METESKWVIWQNNSEDSNIKSWGEDLKIVGEFNSVPQFMFLNDKINEVGLKNLESIRIFKDGIKPMWEDPKNLNGGRVIIDIPVMSRLDLNDIWSKTMAMCISNLVEGICGCVLTERQSLYKIALWIEEDDANFDIIKKWKEIVEVPVDMFYYLTHKKSLDGNKHKRKWNKR